MQQRYYRRSLHMSALRQNMFLQALQALKNDYPEYAEILAFLIEKVEQGQHEKIQLKIQQLKTDEW
jgi:hypothetical protein